MDNADFRKISEKLRHLPDSPGVYIMRNSEGRVIYVGKATCLRSRVRSYFQPASQNRRPTRPIERHIHEVDDLEYIATRNEIEALMLESNLVRRHMPPYNVTLRSDKRYPYIKVATDNPFPYLTITRDISEGGGRFFGPFINTAVARQFVKELSRIFSIRTCDKTLRPNSRNKPCLNYHMGWCSAPCAAKIDEEEYAELVKSAITLLSGGKMRLIKELESEMKRAAAELRFERAAKLRDRLQAVRDMTDHQSVISPSAGDEDVIGIAHKGEEACIQILMVRDGKVVEREHFFLLLPDGASPGEGVSMFLRQFYTEGSYVPENIVLQEHPEDEELLLKWLTELRGGRVSFQVPRSGRKARLIEIAHKNADLLLKERDRRFRDHEADNPALSRLQEVLGLDEPPFRIDAFDISNIGETNPVGGMVVFENGEPSRSWYRRFKIKTVEGQDDYAMLAEVITRHYSRVVKGREPQPDLILIDGGKGQLNSAFAALREVGLDVPMISLAKEFEHIFRPGDPDPIVLDKRDEALKLLQRIRDEVHRFALTFHRKLRSRRMSFSILDKIPGVGPKRKRALIRRFGSIGQIMIASVDEIAAIDGMTRPVAERVKQFLNENCDKGDL